MGTAHERAEVPELARAAALATEPGHALAAACGTYDLHLVRIERARVVARHCGEVVVRGDRKRWRAAQEADAGIVKGPGRCLLAAVARHEQCREEQADAAVVAHGSVSRRCSSWQRLSPRDGRRSRRRCGRKHRALPHGLTRRPDRQARRNESGGSARPTVATDREAPTAMVWRRCGRRAPAVAAGRASALKKNGAIRGDCQEMAEQT